MILNTNILPVLLSATDKAIPEMGDSELTVPNSLLPSFRPLLPLNPFPDTNNPAQESYLHEYQNDISNAAAGSQLLFKFSKGVWTLDLRVNYALVGSAGTYLARAFWFTLDMSGGYQKPILSDSIYSAALQKSWQSVRLRFLLRDTATLTARWQAAAVGERIAFDSSFLCTREL